MNKKTTHIQMLSTWIKIIWLGILLVALTKGTSAQNTSISFQIARDITGSGLGGNVCPSFSLNHKKNTFSIGPNFQRKRLNFSGIQANYSFTAASNYNNRFELYFSGNLTIHTSARMSCGNIEIEKSCHREGTIDYEAMRLNVIEGYAGIGLKFNATKKLSTGFNAGLGMFDTLNENYDREMYREKISAALQLGFVVIYNFKRG